MKYIITNDNEIYIFSDSVKHSSVVPKEEARSAGFVYLSDEGRISCRGESISLNIKSRGDSDAEFIGRELKQY